jgi:nucleoside-diphosphate-sugar epimerase
MMNVLIIGGTRNMGHLLVHALVADGCRVTTFNRGLTVDELPAAVTRLHGDRTVRAELEAALNKRQFDVVVDFMLYSAEEAEAIVDLLRGRVGHYIFISTGQVYLVRQGLERPFAETDYSGPIMPAPKPNTYGYEEWRYGVSKRGAEDALAAAWQAQRFPYTSLRLPMVNSERDPFRRLYNYMLRIKDGGPILVPHTPHYALRHVYAHDVVQAIRRLMDTRQGLGEAYNLSQDETVMLPELIQQICALMDKPMPELIEVKRSLLEANGFLPDCSPFSDRWMSELTNDRSKAELGLTYTPLPVYLERIVRHYQAHPPQRPASYKRRSAERNLVLQTTAL